MWRGGSARIRITSVEQKETARMLLRCGPAEQGASRCFETDWLCRSLCTGATSCSYIQFHCITRWLKTRSTCPLDDEEWDFVMY